MKNNRPPQITFSKEALEEPNLWIESVCLFQQAVGGGLDTAGAR